MSTYKCPKCALSTADPEDVARQHCPFCQLFAANRTPPVIPPAGIPELAHLPGGRDLTRQQCFSVASVAMFHFGKPESRLVHGWVRNSFPPPDIVLHAWVETSAIGEFVNDANCGAVVRPVTMVIDYTQPDQRCRLMERDRYYQQLGVRHNPPPKRYTRTQMIAEAYRCGTDGPWEPTC